jgi:hypothetical protein
MADMLKDIDARGRGGDVVMRITVGGGHTSGHAALPRERGRGS